MELLTPSVHTYQRGSQRKRTPLEEVHMQLTENVVDGKNVNVLDTLCGELVISLNVPRNLLSRHTSEDMSLRPA